MNEQQPYQVTYGLFTQLGLSTELLSDKTFREIVRSMPALIAMVDDFTRMWYRQRYNRSKDKLKDAIWTVLVTKVRTGIICSFYSWQFFFFMRTVHNWMDGY